MDGNILIKDITVNCLTLKTNDGNVDLENSTITERLYCATIDGNIKGILNGKNSEYSIHTTTVENSFSSNTGENKKIEIITKDGNVNISFNEM